MPDTLEKMAALLDSLAARVADLERLEAGIPITGTWTPIWSGSGTAGVFTYVTQDGVYTLVGKLCYISARLSISAIGTPPVGNMRIAGLPFTCEATYNHAISFGFISNRDNIVNTIQMTGLVGASSALITLWESIDNAAIQQVTATTFGNPNIDLILSGCYRTA